MTFKKNFASPHVHIQSLDSASTVKAFAAREKELNTGIMTTTDHGSMGACVEVYHTAKKNGLTAALGAEAYFRDDDCPILKAEGISNIKEYFKYGHLTVHYLDIEAYEAGCRLLSDADARAERHGSERKPLFDWKAIEELGSYNTIFTSSCLAGVVQRHLLADRFDIALKYYDRIRSLVKPGNFYVEVFPHKCDKYWVKGIFLRLEGEDSDRKLWDDKKIKIDIEGEEKELTAIELTKLFARKNRPKVKLTALKNRQTWEPLDPPKEILKAEFVEDFLPNECRNWCPDGDVQKGANIWMLHQAKKHGDPVLISDDSHYAHKEEKIVQDIKLMAGGGSWRFYGEYNRMSSDEAWDYFRTIGVSPAVFEGWIENSHQWAERFKGFEFKSRKSLPTSFYPQNTLKHLKELIDLHGRMDWKNKRSVDRLKAEINLLHNNGTIDLLPYFFLDEEVCRFSQESGALTGWGRGSAAGLLTTYLLGITHVNPLDYNLSMDRFMTMDRIESGRLPDIDQDLSQREIIVDPETGWLKSRFGDHFAAIATSTTLRLKSAIKDVHRVLDGRVSDEIHDISKHLPTPPQGISDSEFVFGYKDADGNEVKGLLDTDENLQAYVEKYPQHWEIVKKSLGLQRSLSQHACLPVGTLVYIDDERTPLMEIEKCDSKVILTGQGNKAQAKLLNQGKKEVLEFLLENGETLRCTADHLFLTPMGWKTAQEIFASNLDLIVNTENKTLS